MILLYLKDKMQRGQFLMAIRSAPSAFSLYLQVTLSLWLVSFVIFAISWFQSLIVHLGMLDVSVV